VHHLDSWVKRDQLEATCFIITLFSAQHVSDVNTFILRNLRLIRWVTSWVLSGSMCVGVTLQCGYGGVISVCSLKHSSATSLHFTSLQLATNSLSYFMGCIWFDVCWCYFAVWLWWCDIHMQAEALQCVFTSLHFSLRLIRWITSWVVSGSMRVGVTLQCGYGGVISICRLKHFSASSLHFTSACD